MKSNYPIPYDIHGNQIHYPEGQVVYIQNETFYDRIKIEGYSRGRSAAYFNAVSHGYANRKYTIFISDFMEIVDRLPIDRGEIPMTPWTFIKRGSNYGLCIGKEALLSENRLVGWKRVFAWDYTCSECGAIKSQGSKYSWKYEKDRWFHLCDFATHRWSVGVWSEEIKV